jgi:hypothetical protein
VAKEDARKSLRIVPLRREMQTVVVRLLKGIFDECMGVFSRAEVIVYYEGLHYRSCEGCEVQLSLSSLSHDLHGWSE